MGDRGARGDNMGNAPGTRRFKYKAFISYARADRKIAVRLQRDLERFVLRRERGEARRPKRPLKPIFRDEDELVPGRDLPRRIAKGLENAEFLIVLASPAAVKSTWVEKEILDFIALRGEDNIITLVVSGEPNAADPGEECLPRPLRFQVTREGTLTDIPAAEPLWLDWRPEARRDRTQFLRLVAALLSFESFDDLVQRDRRAERARARFAYGLAASFALIAALAVGSAYMAYQYLQQSEERLAAAIDIAAAIVEEAVALSDRYGIPSNVVGALLERADREFARLLADSDDPDLKVQYAELLVQFSIHYERIGDLKKAMEKAEGAVGQAREVLERDPERPDANFWLAWGHNKIGDIRRAQGDLGAALKAYEAGLEIAQRLADADPDNAGWQRELSISWERIGDIRGAQGDLGGALKAYEAGLEIRQRLADADPDNAGWQRDLSVSWNKIGDIRGAQGDLGAALKAYEAGLEIRQRLADADPDNAGWQRDLSVSWERIGDIRRAQGDLGAALKAYEAGLEIRQRLADADPDNAGWQRDLSVSWSKIGDIRRAQGDLGAALKAYEAGLEIAQRLADADPDNAGWQRDLSFSWNKIGDIRRAQGDLGGALKAYEAGLEIRQRLADADPDNAGWQRDLFVSHARIGLVHEAADESAMALAAYHRAEKIIRPLTQKDPTNATWKNDLAWVEAAIARVESGNSEADVAALAPPDEGPAALPAYAGRERGDWPGVPGAAFSETEIYDPREPAPWPR